MIEQLYMAGALGMFIGFYLTIVIVFLIEDNKKKREYEKSLTDTEYRKYRTIRYNR